MNQIEKLENQITTLRNELQRLKMKDVQTKEPNRPDNTGGGADYLSDEKDSVIKSRLWSSISHEIMTPMDAILGMTDLVLDTNLTSEQRKYLEMINTSADRLFSVVSDVIDYSKLAEEKLRQDFCNFNILDVLEYDLYVARFSAKHKDLKFTYSFAKDIPLLLNSDPRRLRQVLNTLVNNAIKFTSDGEIQVTVEPAGYDDNRRLLLKFTVKDTGVGLSNKVQKTIFKKPLNVHLPGGEDKYSVGGLGLVVSAKLVDLFGGEIGVNSESGGGATFWFTWPVVDPVSTYMGELPPDILSEKQDRSLVLHGAKVLLAEDEHINASITKAILEQAGMSVTVVNDGEEAISVVGKGSYQAVLMDVQMPVMDGLMAAQVIRKKERKRGTRVPIIALTAHAMQGDRERCLQAGMDDYLAKPLDRDLLVDMLVKYLTRKALIVGSDQENQQKTIQPLVEKGWSVTIAETGRLAKYEASLTHFDLIVIDTSMPIQEGLETISTIRRLEEFSGCRATILGVGNAGKKEVLRYEKCGIDEFFLAPEGMSFREKVYQLD